MQEWDTILENTTSNEHTILAGDFNAHNQSWNCHNTDDDGSRLPNASEKYDLFLHKVDSHTHIDSNTGNKSNLDLLFSTMSIAPYIETQVFDHTMGSDHYPITETLYVEISTYTKKNLQDAI